MSAKSHSKPSLSLYSWRTPNGRKVSILLEELGLPYEVVPININEGEQFKPEFLAISPNNKIPALVDHEEADLSVFESGAILLYLADKYGQFIPKDKVGRAKTLEWLFWQMGGLGPMFGQLGYFNVFAPEPVPAALERYSKEVSRLLGVLDKRLAESPFVAGADYTIADMAIYPWINTLETFYKMGHLLDGHAKIRAWYDLLSQRPAVQKGMAVLSL